MANDTQNAVKISGYLEKKGKMKMVSSWKKYWFVLEGRLLTYYRSKDEYEAISPCKGSISLGPPCKIKPAQATPCIVQIETRSNTITLRAESRYEQERWMHAILAALNQFSSNSPNNRMSHFRYSSDDLPAATAKLGSDTNQKTRSTLTRQNTMPDRPSNINPPTKGNTRSIIQRLQNLGAQSYCESLTKAITNPASPVLRNSKENKRSSFKLNSQGSESSLTNVIPEVTRGNRQPLKKQSSKTNSIIVDNDQYCTQEDILLNKEKTSRELKSKSVVIDNEQYCTTEEAKDAGKLNNRWPKSKSVIVDNDQYCTQEEIKESKRQNSKEFKTNSANIEPYQYLSAEEIKKIAENVVVDNDQYCTQQDVNIKTKSTVDSRSQSNFQRHSKVYASCEISELAPQDVFKNFMETSGLEKSNDEIILRQQQFPIRENIYERISGGSILSEDEMYDHLSRKSIRVSNKSENDSVFWGSANERLSSDSSHCEQPSDALTNNLYCLPGVGIPDLTDHNKNAVIINNDTYITNGDQNQEDDMYAECKIYDNSDDIYAAVDPLTGEETIYEEPDKIKLFQGVEPQLPPRHKDDVCASSTSLNINEPKKIKRENSVETVSSSQTKPKKRQKSFISKMLNWRKKSNEKIQLEQEKEPIQVNDEGNTKTELDQSVEILSELQKILNARKCELEKKIKVQKESDGTEKKEESQPQTKEGRPEPITKAPSPMLTIPQKRNENPPSPPKKPKKVVQVPSNLEPQKKLKTIDEILEDLDKEKNTQDSKLKVKELIEKFENENDPTAVVLRPKSPQSRQAEKLGTYRYSEELTRLLEELATVTNAPIMAPGVTSSLVTNSMSDDEWLKLMPIRYRRKSDPDYDIPRPHRSLQLLNRKSTNTPNENMQTPQNEDTSKFSNMDSLMPTSMTPDSLEIEQIRPDPNPVNILQSNIEHERNIDRTSQDSRSEKLGEVIYARPRAIIPSLSSSRRSTESFVSGINNNFCSELDNANSECFEESDVQQYFKMSPPYEESGVKSLDVFVDSLEPCAEISTTF